MSPVIADGLIPRNRQEIGNDETGSSPSEANLSPWVNGQSGSVSPESRCETGLKAAGQSSVRSQRLQLGSVTEISEGSLRPLAIDLFTGLHGWAEGLVAEGWRVVGLDLEDMCGQFGRSRPPHVQLVIQDVLTLHGRQFKDAALIVASPPCQEFSYMAMPWTKAKEKAARLRDGRDDPKRLTSLFDACFRIQREACEAAGRYVPLVVENVCGAQKWVGRARWHYGSFYLWGDVPALMPITGRAKVTGTGSWFYAADNPDAFCWRKEGHTPPGVKAGWQSQANGAPMRRDDGVKQAGIAGTRKNGKGDCWFQDGAAQHGSKSSARKAASAHIAKIPYELSRHIGRAWWPEQVGSVVPVFQDPIPTGSRST